MCVHVFVCVCACLCACMFECDLDPILVFNITMVSISPLPLCDDTMDNKLILLKEEENQERAAVLGRVRLSEADP